MRKVDPHKFILPLVGYEQSKDFLKFLGTSFFVEGTSNPLLVTVNHNLDGWNGDFGILPYREPIRPAELIAQHPEVDLALLHVPEYYPDKPLKIAGDAELLINQLVNCYEYSDSWFPDSLFPKGDDAHTIKFSPSCRLGNITRFDNFTDLPILPSQAGEQMLVLSFAALQGASGAPVVSNTDLHLWGIVTANWAEHLLPAQVVTVLDEKNQLIEEVNYMLPQALAIHVKHLRSILEREAY